MIDRLINLMELLNESPEDAFLRYAVALEYVSRNDDDTALQFFITLKEQHPEYLPMYYQLGKLYERMQKTDLAIKTYDEGMVVAANQKDMHTRSELQSALDDLY